MSRRCLLIALLVFIAVSVACSAPPPTEDPTLPEGVNIRTVDDIIDQPLEVTGFASDGTATLPIETSIPVACTIVYGPSPAFGSLTLDQDMAGGTHYSHSPLLRGLAPETKYYFRVQGVDDNGILYLSEVLTFTTPQLEVRQTENLASPELGATIQGFSSAFGNASPGDRWGAQSAFDDNPNTEWSSAGDGSQAWIEVELAQKAQIEQVEFQSRAMNDGSAITLAFTVTTEGGQVFGPFELPDASQPYAFTLDTTAQSLRFDLVDSTGGNTGIVDVAVYGQFVEE